MDKLLYGVAYYDEYMPYDRLEKDILMMQAAGINVVRIGESTWSTMEPQPGLFDTSHLIRVIEAMQKADISVILGTPTYAIPSWLARAYPEILAVTDRGKELYGRRQNMDITHPAYLFHAERIIRKMMECCVHYSNVIGVQLDNETKAYGTSGPNVQQGFVRYLKQKFDNDTDALNKAFGLDYWSNRIDAWEDVPDVRGTINGSLGAEYKRYLRKIAADFLMWQRNIVEPYLRKDQFITHNTDLNWTGYSYGLNGEVDVFEDAKATTVLGVDIYHPSQSKLTGMEIAFGGDLTRSAGKGNYLVLETEAQGFPEWLPYDGQLRLQAFSHLASGASMVEYWHWHSIHNSFETYWKGLLSHDFEENETYQAAKTIGREFRELEPHLLGFHKKNRTAILVSNTALTAVDYFPISGFSENTFKYNDVLMNIYCALYKNNVECDILFPQDAEERISNYDLVIIPALYAASEQLLNQICRYTERGGHVLITYKSAFSDENSRVWADRQPHHLTEVCGITYSHFTVPDNVGLISTDQSVQGEASQFMELLKPNKDVEILVRYTHSAYERYPAVTRHSYGTGYATYLGCQPDSDMLSWIVRNTCTKADVLNSKNIFPIIERRGKNGQGKQVVFIFNYSAKTQTAYCKAGMRELINGGLSTDTIIIDPWNFVILEETT